MLGVATLGLLVNLASAAVLREGGETNANVRAAAAHVAADAAGSMGAIIAGLMVWKLGWNRADPVMSIAISILILWSSWRLVREAVGRADGRLATRHRPSAHREDDRRDPGRRRGP